VTRKKGNIISRNNIIALSIQFNLTNLPDLSIQNFFQSKTLNSIFFGIQKKESNSRLINKTKIITTHIIYSCNKEVLTSKRINTPSMMYVRIVDIFMRTSFIKLMEILF